MEIERKKSTKTAKFKDLEGGEVFIVKANDSLYMKLHEPVYMDNGSRRDAVLLNTGAPVKADDALTVIVPASAKLHVQE